MTHRLNSSVLLLLVCSICVTPLHAQSIRVQDDRQHMLTLDAPAQRIVSLAPHITELLFAIGAGDRVVGTVDYSDYPAAAKTIPRIGSFARFDFEAIAALKPDLVIAWYSGNPAQQVAGIEQLGIPVFFNEPSRLDDIALSLRRFGVLTGHGEAAEHSARHFESELQTLRATYGQASPLRVFYEVWDQPLMTINGKHLISDVIRLCGGVNIFAELAVKSPRVDIEAVIARRPQVIVAGIDEGRTHWLPQWRQWADLPAVAGGHLYAIDPELITRHTPRVLKGARQLCKYLQQVRGGQAQDGDSAN